MRSEEFTTGPRGRRLCRAHPLEVTASRRHDWYRATGRDGDWVIPDWAAVAEHYDAAHLTTAAYLAGATCALEVDQRLATVIAGWGPDVTVWLIRCRSAHRVLGPSTPRPIGPTGGARPD